MEAGQPIVADVPEAIEDQPHERESFLTRTLQIRYILALMGFWCFFVLSALRLNISIGIVAMVNWTAIKSELPQEVRKEECKYDYGAVRRQQEDGPFLWDPDIQGHILSSYFYGLAATQLLGGRVSELVSAKYVLLIGTLLAAVANTLIPVVANAFLSGYPVMALQIFKGFGQVRNILGGIMMPAFSVLMGKWVPPTERARFMAVIASGMPVGGFFTVVISGILCHSKTFGWPYVFYVFGIVAIIWCLLWMVLIYDSPLSHPYISRRELNRIMSLRTQKAPILKYPVPVAAILTSSAVWAYISAGFASFWALCLYVSVVPLFLGTVLKFNIETNGLMSAMPNIAEALILVSTSVVSDRMLKKGVLTATTIRKICICTGLFGFAFCMTMVTFTGCHRVATVLLLVMALGLSGFSFSSTAVVPVDMAPRFAGTISGIMNTFGALSGVIIPMAVGYLTRNAQTMNEWSIIFYFSSSICVAAGIIFICFGSSEKQPWNNPAPEKESSAELDSSIPTGTSEYLAEESSPPPSSSPKY
ncbi:putative inorganic phosphate cotransporter like protein [Argiope bruennichi]|uniref:Putative inorganic phosphate cotransporter like protein n=1 Tax=Argiope bruennichi TaxID=94029 RepID=A0A8T0EK65_ARGBR|nr:putative inorganic phosphate cotransporter like protein [Argiope bruennichi]